MKKSSGIASGVIIVGVAAWLGATWYTGKTIETESQQYLTSVNKKLENISPLRLRIEQLSYERGWFSSQARYGISLTERDASGGEPSSERLEFTSHIDHGPFPKGAIMRGVLLPKLAYAHTELSKTDKLAKVFELFKGVSPITSDDIVGYGGKISSRAQIAPLQMQEDEVTLNFSGMRIDGTYELSRQTFNIDAYLDSLTLNSQDNKPVDLRVSGLSLKGNSQPGKFGIGIGDSSLNIKRLDVDLLEEDKQIAIDTLGYTAKITENDKTIAIHAAYQTGDVKVNGLSVGSGQTVIKLDQLDGAALKQLSDIYNQIMSQMMKGDSDFSSEDEKLLTQAHDNLRKLLAGQPSFSIAPLSWKTDKGESNLTASVSLDLPKDLDTQDLKETVIQAIKNIDVKLVLSKPMIEALIVQYGITQESLTPEEAAETAKEQINSLAGLAEMLNVGKNHGDDIIGTFVFANGVGNLNGTEIPAEELFSMLSSAAASSDDEVSADEFLDEDAVAAAAEADEALEIFQTFEVEHVVNMLDDLGHSVTIDTDGDAPILHLDAASVGADSLRLKFLCDENGEFCEDLVFIAEYKSRKPLPLRKINSWNQEYRWTRLYLDDDGQTVLEMDLNSDGGLGARNLRILTNTFISIAEDAGEYVASGGN